MAIIVRNQRALILQGGVALGAYEAGVIKALSERLSEQDRENGEPNRPLFDIVAGTSIGALNAAILVSYVKQRRKWEGAADELIRFWHHLAEPTPLSGQIAEVWLGEAGRRYYSTKEFFRTGVKNVFSQPRLRYDYRFYDNSLVYPDGLPNVSNNIWYQYSNRPLRNSIEQFVQFPIATSSSPLHGDEYNNNDFTEPRLIVVSVDVELGQAVAFDSYPYMGTKCEICQGQFDKNEKLVEHVYKDHLGAESRRRNEIRWTAYGKAKQSNMQLMQYHEGIQLGQLMASASFPVFFEYENLDDRKFWDGGVLSNTPLREVIGLHREYWTQKIPPSELAAGMWEVEDNNVESRRNRTRQPQTTNRKVPSLDVYIVSV